MKQKLTQEENEIIDYVENQSVQSIDNLKDEISRYTNMAKSYTSKKKL